MADKERKLKWLLWADAQKFKSGLRDAKGELSSFQKSTSSMFSGIQKAAIAAFSVTAVFQYAKVAVQAANVQLQAEAKLTTALQGRADLTRELGRLASELQGKTLFGDEATLEAAAQLAMFVKEEEQIKKLLPLIQDMAQAKNMDLVQTAGLVAKTIGSSTNALSRYGLEITGVAGSSERAESAIEALNGTFKGFAETAAKTGTGSITQFKNTVGDLNEQVGAFIITWQKFLATSKLVNGVLSETNKTLTILSAWGDFSFWERFFSPFESQSKTYARALKKIEEQAKKTERGIYDMAQDAMPADSPTMVNIRALLKDIQDLGEFSGERATELKEPAPEVKTKYEELNNTLAELKKTQADLAARNKDISDITARISGIQLEIDKIDELIQKKQESSYFDTKYGGTFTPAASITGTKTTGLSTTILTESTGQLADIGGLIEANTLKAETAMMAMRDTTIEIGREIEGVFQSMAVGIGESLGNMIAGVEGYDNAGNMILGVLADLAIQVGQIAVGVGVATLGIKESLESLNPVVAIAAGTALIALGTAAKGMLKSAAGGGNASGVYDTRSFASQQQMIGLQANAMRVEIVGETQIRNKDIYIAYKNAETGRKLKT